MRFIGDHAHLPLRVGDVLRAVSASRRSLEQKFRTMLRHGIAEEVRRVHVERAKNLLLTTMLSMSEVAAHSGFTSAQALSRVFRRETGCTPTAFRNKARLGENR